MDATYRSRSLRELAHRMGFGYCPDDEFNLLSQLQDFHLFSEGRQRRIENVLRHQHGMLEFDVSIFDYSYTHWTRRRNNKPQRLHQTVYFVQSRHLGLPELHLRPETVLHKIGELFGMEDIDFVRYPKFSRHYRLTGEDEEYIRHHFTDEVLNYFTVNKGWAVEGLGYYLLVYRKGLLLPGEEIEYLYRRGEEVFKLLRTGMPDGPGLEG